MRAIFSIKDYSGEINRCLQCNFCLATCPIYREDMVESSVARGRVNLINAAMVEKTLPLSDRARDLINRCLLCSSCVQGCPSGIPVDDIIIAARHELIKKYGLGMAEKYIFRRVLKTRSVGPLASKVVSMLRRLKLFPGQFPELANPAFNQRVSGTLTPAGLKRARVAYFIGCGTNYLYPDTGDAVIKVLLASGVEVIVPKNQHCCGIPALAHGDLESALDAIRGNAEIFASLDVDAVITDCTSCGYMFRVKAVKALPPDDPCLKKALSVAEKTFEATEYIVRLGLVKTPLSRPVKTTYHVPCHRAWSKDLPGAPRRLASMIPDLQLLEMREPQRCCGAGGAFFLNQPDLSESIRRRKTDDILETRADVVMTQCPACRYYLHQGLKNQPGLRVVHPVSLLADGY